MIWCCCSEQSSLLAKTTWTWLRRPHLRTSTFPGTAPDFGGLQFKLHMHHLTQIFLSFRLDLLELVWPWVQCMGLVSRLRFLDFWGAACRSLRSTKLRKETAPSSYSPINSITKCTWPSPPTPSCFLLTAPTRPSSFHMLSQICNVQ